MQRENPCWRVVEPCHWHVTLAFPGNVSPERFDESLTLLEEFSKSLAPLDLNSRAYRWMPEKSASMLWLDLQPSAAFDRAFNALHEKLRLRSRHPPRPHVTLMRGKSRQPLRAGRLPSIEGDVRLRANCLNAYESFLRAGGSRYALVASYSLELD